MRHHDERRQQRPQRLPGIAAHLERRLRKAEAPARGEPRDARTFGVKHRRAEADQRRADQQQPVVARKPQNDQPHQRRGHAASDRIGQRPLVGVDADHRLQQRRRALEGQRQEAKLHIVEPVALLEDRIDRRQQRLHDVVDQVTGGHRKDDRERRLGRGAVGQGGHGHGKRSRKILKEWLISSPARRSCRVRQSMDTSISAG